MKLPRKNRYKKKGRSCSGPFFVRGTWKQLQADLSAQRTNTHQRATQQNQRGAAVRNVSQNRLAIGTWIAGAPRALAARQVDGLDAIVPAAVHPAIHVGAEFRTTIAM